MARSSILALAHEVADDLGMSRPPTLFGDYNEGDTNDTKLKRAVTKTARFLHRFWHWPDTRAEITFASGATGAQVGVLPADFQRLQPDSVRDILRGEVAVHVAAILPLAPGFLPNRIEVMVRNGVLHLRSPYAVGAQMQLAYVRNSIGVTAADAPLAAFAADTDRALWDDELMHLGMAWAIKNRDGDRTSEDYQEFVGALMDEMNHHAPGGDLVWGAPDSSELQPPRLPTGPW